MNLDYFLNSANKPATLTNRLSVLASLAAIDFIKLFMYRC